MIEIMKASHGNLVGVQASGSLTVSDYEDVLLPHLEKRFEQHGKLRILFYMDPSFTGWDLAAAWEDAKIGLSHWSDFEKIAVVGGPGWVEACMRLFGFLMKGEVRTFGEGELEAAWRWLGD